MPPNHAWKYEEATHVGYMGAIMPKTYNLKVPIVVGAHHHATSSSITNPCQRSTGSSYVTRSTNPEPSGSKFGKPKRKIQVRRGSTNLNIKPLTRTFMHQFLTLCYMNLRTNAEPNVQPHGKIRTWTLPNPNSNPNHVTLGSSTRYMHKWIISHTCGS